MTFRVLMTLSLALGMTACSGGGGGGSNTDTKTNPDGGGGGDDDDNNTDTQTAPTGETGTGTHTTAGGFIPNHLVVRAVLVIDGPNGVLTTATDPKTGGTLDSFVEMLWGDDAWVGAKEDPTLTDHYCYIDMPLTNSAQAAWLPTGSYFGVDYDGGVPNIQATCGDADHPMDALFPGGPYTSTGGSTYTATAAEVIVDGFGPWGAGIGPANGLITPTFDPDGITIGGLIGPSTFLNPVPPTSVTSTTLPTDITAVNHYYAVPFAVDADFQTEYDAQNNPIFIDPAQVFDGTNVASGVYSISDFYIWTFTP